MQRLVGLVLLLGLAAGAGAQEIRGGYVGANAGWFSYEQPGFSDGAGSYRLVGGYQLNDYYAVEAGWGETSNLSEGLIGIDSAGNLAPLDVVFGHEIATVRFLAFAPFSRLALFGGIGYYDMSSELTVTFASPVDGFRETAEDSDSGATILGGVQHEWNRFALRGEYEWFDASHDVEASNISVTFLLRF